MTLMHCFFLFLDHLVTGGPRYARVVSTNQSSLILIVRLGLAEREAALTPHPLGRPDLLDRLLESCKFSAGHIGVLTVPALACNRTS
jgi:hypothetical protein